MPYRRWLPIEVHAVCDAGYFAALILLAVLADFAGHGAAALYAGTLAGGGIMLYLLSGAPLGLFPMISLRWHSVLEYLAVPLTLFLPPWLFPDSPLMVWGLPVLGLVNLAVNALSDYPVEPEIALSVVTGPIERTP